MNTVVQKDYGPMRPAPLSDEQWKAKAAKVAGDFFEGPAKRFLEEWDPKKPNHNLENAVAERAYPNDCNDEDDS
jgi:hypothetical protein